MQRAETFLREHIGSRPRGTRLAPITQLAGMAGVSMVTMLRAVRVLRSHGLLLVSHGKGTRVAGPETASADTYSPAPSVPRRRWEQVRRTIERDITDGRYRAGETLPTRKELCDRYGVCHATLARAVQSLVAQSAIGVRCGRLTVPRVQINAAANTILLLARGDDDGNLLIMTPRIEEHLRTLERECARLRLRLLVRTVNHSGEFHDIASAQGTGSARVTTPDALLGALIWTIGMETDVVGRILSSLHASATPMALLCEHGPALLPVEQIHASRPHMVFTAHDHGAGEQVGRYLRELGHEHVAYISPVHGSDWSQRRLEGLRKAMGNAAAVHSYLLPKLGQGDFVSPDLRPVTTTIERQLRAIIGGGHLSLDHVPSATTRTLEAAVEHNAMGVALEPLLDRALALRNVRAWVAASDSIALLCMDYLRRHGRSIPSDISVVGFDDALDAFLHRLTSYNFNGSAAIHAMLNVIVNQRVRASPPLRLSFDGFVAQRSTVIRARADSTGAKRLRTK